MHKLVIDRLFKFYSKILSYVNTSYSLVLYKNKSRRSRVKKFIDIIKNIKCGNLPNYAGYEFLKTAGMTRRKLPKQFISLLISHEDKPQFINKLVTQIPSSNFSTGSWLELSMYLFGLGYVQASLDCRIKSYDTVNSLSNKIFYNLLYPYIQASSYFDIGVWENSKSTNISDVYIDFFFKRKRNIGKRHDPEFFKYINNKCIAVIGPLAPDSEFDYTKEILGVDIMVGINVLNDRIINKRPKYGRKPDVIYYNGKMAMENETKMENLFSDDVKFWVFKRHFHYEHFKKYDVVPTTFIPSTNLVEYTGSSKMIESTLLHLLLNDPKEIRVYDADLEYSLTYDPTYVSKDVEVLSNNYYERNTHHDSFTQYNIMHNLYKKGYIKADKRLGSVLEMGIRAYAQALEENFRKK